MAIKFLRVLFFFLLLCGTLPGAVLDTKTAVLENQNLHIEISPLGAELKSIFDKTRGREILWQGDPAYWAGQSPVLFPFVGKLWDGGYYYQGVKYPMKTHGFADTKTFELWRATASEVWFRLSDSEETRKIYPFAFELRIGYVLQDKSLKVIWEVENKGSETMHFQIGGHTGFRLADFSDDDELKAYARFETKGKSEIPYIVKEKDKYYAGQPLPRLAKLDGEGVVPLTRTFFKDDAVVFDTHDAKALVLLDKEKHPVVTVRMETPLFALWTSKKNAPFICIEPWCGRGDKENFTGDISTRDWEQHLQPGKVFSSSYSIEVM